MNQPHLERIVAAKVARDELGHLARRGAATVGGQAVPVEGMVPRLGRVVEQSLVGACGGWVNGWVGGVLHMWVYGSISASGKKARNACAPSKHRWVTRRTKKPPILAAVSTSPHPTTQDTQPKTTTTHPWT
jgi:hypothetical protein